MGMLVEIPEDLVGEFEAHKDQLREIILLGLRQLKVQESLYLYREGVISFERAAELAGVSTREMMQHAIALGIKPRWSEKMVAEELA